MKYKRNNNGSSIETTTRVVEKNKSNFPNGNSLPKKEKHAGGRPLKYNPDLFPKQAYIACSRMGASYAQLAELFGIKEGTIYNWIKSHPEFLNAIKKGTDEWINEAAMHSLRQLVTGFEYQEITIKEYTISQGRGKDKITLPATETITMTKRKLPELGAVCFWLKNKKKTEDGDREFKDYKAVEIGNLDDDKPLKIRVTLESQDEE